MTSLKSFLDHEEFTYFGESKTAVYTFGRFNPPTKNHGKLIESVIRIAAERGADHFVIPSPRTADEKNPLPFEIKLAFMKQLYPGVNITENVVTDVAEIPIWLGNAGYTDLVMVVSEDKVDDFKRLSNRATQHFNSFEIVSSGTQNPDALSAPKAREAALLEDIGKFRVATGWSGEIAERLMEATRISMGAK